MTSNPVFDGSFLGRSSGVCDFISPVAQPKDCVGGNHQDVEQIEKENRVKMVKQFVGDARQISQNEYQKEEQTFSLGGAGFPGAHDGKGPCRPKAQQHQRFQTAQLRYTPLIVDCSRICPSIWRNISWNQKPSFRSSIESSA